MGSATMGSANFFSQGKQKISIVYGEWS
jgi:hypothetical protein